MAIITYDGGEFKSIDCIPEYAEWSTIYVAKTPHVDESGRSYQVINTAWGKRKITHPVYDRPNHNGYLQVDLPRTTGCRGSAYVHRLVFLTWQPELPVNYRELDINHRDETRDNNCFTNLEMITHRDNINYGSHTTRLADSNVKHGISARTVAIEIQTKRDYHFRTTAECARRLDLICPHVTDCLTGRRHKHHGYVFCREEDYSPAKVDELIAAATRRKTKN